MTKQDIHKICRKYNIINYTINQDMSIDVNSGVDLNFKYLKELPLNFNIVDGDFLCGYNRLKSLKGSPKFLDGSYACNDNNHISSLKYSPNYINGYFNCANNNLNSLKYAPNTIKKDFHFDNNNIKSLHHFPNVKQRIYSINNPISELWDLFKNRNYIDHFNDLDIIQDENTVILDRLNYFLTDIGEDEVKKDSIKNYKVI